VNLRKLIPAHYDGLYFAEDDALRATHYRGDTLRFSQDGRFLYATTRGMTPATRGYVTVWQVNPNGTLGDFGFQQPEAFVPVTRYQTPTFGGKANAVEAFPFHAGAWEAGGKEGEVAVSRDWIVLTDDGEGWVWVLEFDAEKGTVEEVAGVQLGRQEGATEEEQGTGASHAVWLS